MTRLLGDLRAAVARFLEHDGFLLASALSFACVLCLAPLTLILFSVAGFLMESEALAEYLFDAAYLLLPAYGQELAEFLGLLARERALTGLVGFASWVVFATQFFSLARSVLNRAFGVNMRRGVLRGFLVDLVAVATVGSLALTFAVAAVVLAALGDAAGRLVPLPVLSPVVARRLVSVPLLYALALALVFLVYRVLPNRRVPARAAALATAAFAVAWEAAGWAFTAYVMTFGTYGRLFGSFGIGIAGLVWIYYSATIFILGAELGAIVTGRDPVPAEATAA